METTIKDIKAIIKALQDAGWQAQAKALASDLDSAIFYADILMVRDDAERLLGELTTNLC